MNDLQIHLLHADMPTIGQEWNSRNVRSTFWRFYINTRDGAGIWYAGSLYPLPSGQIHLIPAYVPFSCHNTSTFRHLYAHFDLLGLPPILQQQLFPSPCSLPLTPDARRLLKLYSTGQLPQTCPVSMCLTHATILQALAQVISALPEPARQRLTATFAGPNPIRPALQLIEQRLPAAISVPELAEVCAFSSDHFTRLFRQIMGQTPGQYVLQRRITRAAAALLYGTKSIDALALEHGFANRFHFTRAFSRHMGTTPAAYRQSQRI